MRLGVGAVLVVALVLAGCTKKADTPQAQPSVGTVVSTTPEAEASTATTSPPPPACQGKVTGGAAPGNPALKAWLCKDTPGMQKYLTAEAVTQLKAVPYDIDLQWTFISCGGAAGSTYCTYRNGPGSQLIFRARSDAPDRAVEVKFDRTLFPADAEQYTRHFIEAWFSGNVERMRALSNPSIVSFAATHPAPEGGYTVTLSPSEVWIFEVESSGADYRFVLQGQLGRANAITSLTVM